MVLSLDPEAGRFASPGSPLPFSSSVPTLASPAPDGVAIACGVKPPPPQVAPPWVRNREWTPRGYRTHHPRTDAGAAGTLERAARDARASTTRGDVCFLPGATLAHAGVHIPCCATEYAITLVTYAGASPRPPPSLEKWVGSVQTGETPCTPRAVARAVPVTVFTPLAGASPSSIRARAKTARRGCGPRGFAARLTKQITSGAVAHVLIITWEFWFRRVRCWRGLVLFTARVA